MRDRTAGNEGKTGEGAGAWGGSFIVYSFRATELLNWSTICAFFLLFLSDGAVGIFLDNYSKPTFQKVTYRWKPRASLFFSFFTKT